MILSPLRSKFIPIWLLSTLLQPSTGIRFFTATVFRCHNWIEVAPLLSSQVPGWIAQPVQPSGS